jgi:hypothetical protein
MSGINYFYHFIIREIVTLVNANAYFILFLTPFVHYIIAVV